MSFWFLFITEDITSLKASYDLCYLHYFTYFAVTFTPVITCSMAVGLWCSVLTFSSVPKCWGYGRGHVLHCWAICHPLSTVFVFKRCSEHSSKWVLTHWLIKKNWVPRVLPFLCEDSNSCSIFRPTYLLTLSPRSLPPADSLAVSPRLTSKLCFSCLW